MPTCQICGRDIEAKAGLIAHHGYARPGMGWQTASCAGAKYRPYEVACDAIPPAIKNCDAFAVREKAKLSALLANPPAQYDVTRRDAYGVKRGPDVIVTLPAGFEPNARRSSNKFGSYEGAFDAQARALRGDIAGTVNFRKYLENRLANWVSAP